MYQESFVFCNNDEILVNIGGTDKCHWWRKIKAVFYLILSAVWADLQFTKTAISCCRCNFEGGQCDLHGNTFSHIFPFKSNRNYCTFVIKMKMLYLSAHFNCIAQSAHTKIWMINCVRRVFDSVSKIIGKHPIDLYQFYYRTLDCFQRKYTLIKQTTK